MATLEKIRNKSVMLIIVIGVALLAFIIGDGISSFGNIFGNRSTVAEVDGDDINIEEFQKRYQEASANQQENEHQDGSFLQQYVVEELVYEKLLDKEYEELGIDVSEEELSYIFFNDPMMLQFVQQKLGFSSVEEAQDVIFNPGNYQIDEKQIAPAREEWLKMEKRIKEELKLRKLSSLLFSCIQPNNLDIKAMKEESNIANVSIVKGAYDAIKDDQIKVTDEDLKELYNNTKQQYKINEEIRKAAYIAVDVVPSDKDNKHAKALMDTLSSQLKAQEGIEAARLNGEVNVQEKTETLASSKTEPWINTFLTSAAVGNVSEIKDYGNELLLVKLLNTKTEVDSINIDMAMIQGPKATQDSILKALNSGKTFKDFANNKSFQGQENVWINLMNVRAQDKEAKDKLLNAKDKEYFVMESNENSASVYRINEKKAPKKMFDIAVVSYLNLPSEETHDKLLKDLETYVSNNNNPEDFVKNSIASGYQAVQTYLTGDMSSLCRIPDIKTVQQFQARMLNMGGHGLGNIMNSRRAVQWVFANEAGSVSPVFDKEGQHGKILAVVVENVIPAEFVPYDDASVKDQLTKEVIKNKKADQIIAKIEGKASDLEGYAKILGTAVDTTTSDFANGLVPMAGVEPALTGAIAGSKKGVVSAPVKGNTGVFVFKVTDKGDMGTKLSDEEAKNRFSQKFAATVVRQLYQVLRAGVEVKTDLGKFYNSNN